MSILIKGGTIVTSRQTYKSDILVGRGKILRIGSNNPGEVDETIEAEGYFVFPGGVDPHVHLHLPTPAGYSADDFRAGSLAALHGGTTTILDFVTPARGQSLVDALNLRIGEAKDCLIDHSFHVSPVDWRVGMEAEIVDCIARGFTSFKIYMAYKDTIGLDDNAIYHVMKAVGRNGGMVTAHCELGDEIGAFRDFYFTQGMTSPKYHCLSRPARLEALAVRRAIDMADQAKCPLYIVHVSAAESLRHIAQAQRGGQPVYAETCPQYLLLDDSRYEGSFEQTAKYVISPPLRGKDDNVALWDAIANGVVKAVGTDHCPFMQTQKRFGVDDFRKIPNGAGGVEHRLALLYTYGVMAGRMSINSMVDVFATQPAKIFGLYPTKGEVAEGSDADLVVWNPGTKSAICSTTHRSRADINIFEGFNVEGKLNT
jgi:dihydropyrimidinase